MKVVFLHGIDFHTSRKFVFYSSSRISDVHDHCGEESFVEEIYRIQLGFSVVRLLNITSYCIEVLPKTHDDEIELVAGAF